MIISKVNTTNVHEIISKYNSGKTTGVIAKEYSTDRGTIIRWLRKNGVSIKDRSESRKGKISPKRLIKDVQELIRLYHTGLSTVKLAEVYKTSHTVIADTLKREKVIMRDDRTTRDLYGNNNPNFKGTGSLSIDGVYLTKDGSGYLRRISKGHPLSDPITGIIGEHVYQACLKWGIDFVKGKEVHHINEIKDDNRIENLVCLTQAEHRWVHNTINNNYGQEKLNFLFELVEKGKQARNLIQ